VGIEAIVKEPDRKNDTHSPHRFMTNVRNLSLPTIGRILYTIVFNYINETAGGIGRYRKVEERCIVGCGTGSKGIRSRKEFASKIWVKM